LEIGTWLGRSAAVWILATGGDICCLDINPDTHKIADIFIRGMGLEATFIVGDSQKLEPAAGEVADVVWIDGDHSYEACLHDIKVFEPKTKVLICGHDYAPSFPGVIQALDEYFGKENVQVDGNIWYILK